MANASINARITSDNRDFKAGLIDSQHAATAWASRMAATRANVARDFSSGAAGGGAGFMGGAFSLATLGRVTAGFAVLTGAAYAANKALNFADNLRDMKDGLQMVGEDAESVAYQLDALLMLSKQPNVDFFMAAEASKKLRAIGYTASETRGIILALANSLAATGEDDQALLSVVDALTKISDKGEVSERQLVALMQVAPKIRDAFKSMGIESAQSLEKLGTDTKQIIAGLVSELQKLPTTPVDQGDRVRFEKGYAKYSMQTAAMKLEDLVVQPGDAGSAVADRARKMKITGPPVDEAATEERRLKNLRLAEREMQLTAEIQQIERGGTRYAASLREELALLQQTDKVMQDLGITRGEAEDFLRKSLALKWAEFEVTKKKADLDKANATREQAEKVKDDDGTGRRRRRGRDDDEAGSGGQTQHPRITSLDPDPDARNERRFNRSRDLKKQYGTFEKYLQRDPELGKMSMEPHRKKEFTGLDEFDRFKKDRNWGRVPTKQEAEVKSHTDKIEKAKDRPSPELKAFEAATKAFESAAASLQSLADKEKSKALPRP